MASDIPNVYNTFNVRTTVTTTKIQESNQNEALQLNTEAELEKNNMLNIKVFKAINNNINKWFGTRQETYVIARINKNDATVSQQVVTQKQRVEKL